MENRVPTGHLNAIELGYYLDSTLTTTIFLSFLFHFAIFYFSPTSDISVYAAKSRIASSVHSVISIGCVLIWMSIFSFDPFNMDRTLGGGIPYLGDNWCAYVVAISVGYFLSDTLVMILYREVYDASSLIHHFLIGTAFLLGLWGRVAQTYHFFFLLEELSTPFLNLKWFLRNESKPHSSKNQMLNYCFILSFFFSRLIYGSILYYSTLVTTFPFFEKHGNSSFNVFQWVLQIILCSSTRILNLYWFSKIIRKLTYSKQERRKQE